MTQNIGQSDIQIAVRTREEAANVLTRLQDARRQSEARLAENGTLDPLKNLTGRSALDRAVETTQGILEHMDDLVKELRRETAATSVSPASRTHGEQRVCLADDATGGSLANSYTGTPGR